MKKYILSLSEPVHTEKTAHKFTENAVPNLPVSASSKKHIWTSIRRFNDYLSGNPYIFRKNTGAQMPPLVFQNIVNDYITYMSKQGYKTATIKVRNFFAVQLLILVYKQGKYIPLMRSLDHAGCTVLSVSFIEGMCQKLPNFLKFLHKKGLTFSELQKAILAVIPKKNLLSVYNRDELIQILSAIDTSTLPGKRDYATLLFLMAYGFLV